MVVALPPAHQSEVMMSNTKITEENKPQKMGVTVQTFSKVRTDGGEFIDIKCPDYGETLSVMQGEDAITCPWCDKELMITK